MFANTRLASATDVAQQGYDGMLRGEMDVLAGLTFGQKMMMAAVPFTPKKMLMRQIRDMQMQRA